MAKRAVNGYTMEREGSLGQIRGKERNTRVTRGESRGKGERVRFNWGRYIPHTFKVKKEMVYIQSDIPTYRVRFAGEQPDSERFRV
eukprot:1343781-Amorphochlora_amoeboformis.AAC.1